uniref:MARVEL domain-containing protein n=1 Tax=Steinernema glaseri TaxID=37863 RepID=A0A1I7Z3M9_9BILA
MWVSVKLGSGPQAMAINFDSETQKAVKRSESHRLKRLQIVLRAKRRKCVAIFFVILTVSIQTAHLIEHCANYGWTIRTATLVDVRDFCQLHLSLFVGILFGVLAIIGLMTERSCLLLPFLICSILISILYIWACMVFIDLKYDDRQRAIDAWILLSKTVANTVAVVCLFMCFIRMRRFC